VLLFCELYDQLTYFQQVYTLILLTVAVIRQRWLVMQKFIRIDSCHRIKWIIFDLVQLVVTDYWYIMKFS